METDILQLEAQENLMKEKLNTFYEKFETVKNCEGVTMSEQIKQETTLLEIQSIIEDIHYTKRGIRSKINTIQKKQSETPKDLVQNSIQKVEAVLNQTEGLSSDVRELKKEKNIQSQKGRKYKGMSVLDRSKVRSAGGHRTE